MQISIGALVNHLAPAAEAPVEREMIWNLKVPGAEGLETNRQRMVYVPSFVMSKKSVLLVVFG